MNSKLSGPEKGTIAAEDPNEHDGLTGLWNHNAVEVRVNLWLEQGHPGSLLLLDAARFSRVNDRWGHLAGDALL